jgi:hypothetical protein
MELGGYKLDLVGVQGQRGHVKGRGFILTYGKAPEIIIWNRIFLYSTE